MDRCPNLEDCLKKHFNVLIINFGILFLVRNENYSGKLVLKELEKKKLSLIIY